MSFLKPNMNIFRLLSVGAVLVWFSHLILPASMAESAEEPIEISVESAIIIALDNNRAVRVERLTPLIRHELESQERAAFDPRITGEFSYSQERTLQQSQSSGEATPIENEHTQGNVGISESIPTGTNVSFDISTDRILSDLYGDYYSTRVGVSVTQSLLKGIGLKTNLARLRQARLDTLSSQYEFRGFAEMLTAQVEKTYWDYALAQRQMEIYKDSLELAERQLGETEEKIEIGKLAEIEIVAAKAEVALRRVELINARSNLAKIRLRLLRLINPPGENLWNRDIILKVEPAVPDVRLDDVESHVRVALRMRPDLNQARLALKRGELELVKTKNGVLPKLDLFITFGETGYADSFGESFSNINGDNYDFLVGVSFEYPIVNRSNRALNRQAMLSREQAAEAVENFAQLVNVDVRTAYIEVGRAREQVAATKASRELQEEKARAETEKFRVGRSTTLLVAQAQRDMLASRITEIESIINYIKALVELYRLEGSLLERRGVSAPGREPAAL